MNKKIIVLISIVVVLLILGSCTKNSYNDLVTAKEHIPVAWAQVDTVLQRRYDLIPNLVNTVKGIAKHEKEVFTEVARLRSQWAKAGTRQQKIQASQGLESALSRLMVVVERYPDLKANQNFLKLQDELAGTENRISVERRRYNNAVGNYNKLVLRIPTNIFAKMFGYERSDDFFKAQEGAKEGPPKVEF